MRTVGILLATLVAAPLLAQPASATSCMAVPDGRPQSIVAGTEELFDDRGFFEVYAFAFTGVVTGIESEGSGDLPGPATITFDVINAFGTETVTTEIAILSPDVGFMLGYPYQLGSLYFVPVMSDADGLHSMVCDPITELTLEDAEALPALAIADVAVAIPTGASTPTTTTGVGVVEPTPISAPVDDRLQRWAVPAIAVGGILVGAVLLGVVRSRRGRQD